MKGNLALEAHEVRQFVSGITKCILVISSSFLDEFRIILQLIPALGRPALNVVEVAWRLHGCSMFTLVAPLPSTAIPTT